MTGSPYDKAPIGLVLNADWGFLSTFVSTFQLSRPIKFKCNEVVALRAQRRHFRLPSNSNADTTIHLTSTNNSKFISFKNLMLKEGDVPNINLDAIVRINSNIDEEAKRNSDCPIVIQANFLRGSLSIQLANSELESFNQYWPNDKQPKRLIFDPHSFWVEADDLKLKLSNSTVDSPAPDGAVDWDILDVSNYQPRLIKSIQQLGNLSENQGMRSSGSNKLQLSVAPYGPAKGVLRVTKTDFQYLLQNVVIFTGSQGTSWVPTWTLVSSQNLEQSDNFYFTDILPDPKRADAPPWLCWKNSDLSLKLFLASSDQRVLALIGSQDSKQLQGSYLWSYQEMDSNWGWIRLPICQAENISLPPKEDPFELGVCGCDPLQWQWRLSVDRSQNASPEENGIELKLDADGSWTFFPKKFHFDLSSPEIRFFSGNNPLVDADCPPALPNPAADTNLAKSRLQFVLASSTSPDGLVIPWKLMNDQKSKMINISSILTEENNLKLNGSVRWTGTPDPSFAWIFTESITGRNLLAGAITAWDPSAGKCWFDVTQLTLKKCNNKQNMVFSGSLQSNPNFQATMALLPWVEGHRSDGETTTQLEVFHRNLICEIDEVRAGRVDRGLLPYQRDQMSNTDHTRAVRDHYASLGFIKNPLSRANFWPGLTLNNLDLSQSLTINVGSEEPSLPWLQIGERTMRLRTEPSNPPTSIPNHVSDWLDYQVDLQSLLDHAMEPKPVAVVTNDGDQDLHRGLLMKDGSWLDQSGALWVPTPPCPLPDLNCQIVYQAVLNVEDNTSFSWKKYGLLSGFITLANDPSLGHYIQLFLDSLLIDWETKQPPTTRVGALPAGAWKLLGTPTDPRPTFFGLHLEGLRIDSISPEKVTLKVLLLAPSKATTTSPIEITFPLNPPSQISLAQTDVSYAYQHLEAFPFPHGGLPAQLVSLTGKIFLENSGEHLNLLFEPGQDQPLGLAFGASWPCKVPVLKAHCGAWINQNPPRTSNAFWIESFPAFADTPHFSSHSLHIEKRSTVNEPPAGFEEEDFSQAGFLIWTANHIQFLSLYEPDKPLRLDEPSACIVAVDLLISRRTFALSSSFRCDGACQIFLIRDNRQNLKVWSNSAQPTFINSSSDVIDDIQGSLLLPISKKEEHGIAIVVWNKQTLRALMFLEQPSKLLSEQAKNIDQDFQEISNVFRIPNQENQLLVISDGKFFFTCFVWGNNPSLVLTELTASPFTSINQIIGIDRSAFIVVDEQKKAYVVPMSELKLPIIEVPNSQDAILVPELDVNHDFVDSRVTPRLFLAKSNDQTSEVYQWRLPKQTNSVGDTDFGEDVASNLIATIACQGVTGGISTPLGPWWYDWAHTAPSNTYTLCVYNLDDWVEWDENGWRADLPITVRLAADSLDSSSASPFRLTCRISRGHTLAVTHQTKESFSPAWPRQAQAQYTAFAVPSHTPQPQTYWSRGFIVLWPELLRENSLDTLFMAGAWFRESWQNKQLVIRPEESYQEVYPGWFCAVEGTLHILQVDWWQNLDQIKWKTETSITGSLGPGSSSNWSLQIHEQVWNHRTDGDPSIIGLLFLNQDEKTSVQLPVCLLPCSPLDPNGESITLKIKTGLYSVNGVASRLNSMELTDLTLPNPAGDGERNYDICPVTLTAENIWCRLTPVANGNLELMSVGPDDQFAFLSTEAKSEFPKQPVSRTQLTHRRVFGSRLRFGSNLVPFQPRVRNAWNVIGNVYNYSPDKGTVNGDSENPDNLTAISRLLINDEADFKEFVPANRKEVWNAQACEYYDDDLDPDWWNYLEPGDQFTAWTPNLNDKTGKKPDPSKVDFGYPQCIGALAAQSAGNIWMFQEPYWVSPSAGDNMIYHTENVLVVARSENTPDPVVTCLRSVTDVVGSAVDRGLDSETLWSFLLECGASGLVVQRLFQASGPPVYRFSRSPFSIPAGEISIVNQSPQINPDESKSRGEISPILLQGQPWNTTTLAALYAPTFESSTAPLPIFSRDYRHVSVQLIPGDKILNRSNIFSSLLLQESVCYDDQAQNDPSEPGEHPPESTPPPLPTSFHPLALDLVYAADKPGAMLRHSLDLYRVNDHQRECGLRTMFAMRDPRQVILPPGAQLRISAPPTTTTNPLTLEFEEILGTLPVPAIPVAQLIISDPKNTNAYLLNHEALLLFTVVGDELIQLSTDSPYLPLDQDRWEVDQKTEERIRCIFLVTMGKPQDSYHIDGAQDNKEFEFAGHLLEDPKPIDANSVYWRSTIKLLNVASVFQLSWKEKISSGVNSPPTAVNFFTKNNLLVSLIPALATPKIGIVTCCGNQQNLDLYGPAKGGKIIFSLLNDSPLIEVSNRYKVSWHRQTAGIDALHVTKYFSDGQTLCASWPIKSK
jgi:hypothetical protein